MATIPTGVGDDDSLHHMQNDGATGETEGVRGDIEAVPLPASAEAPLLNQLLQEAEESPYAPFVRGRGTPSPTLQDNEISRRSLMTASSPSVFPGWFANHELAYV